MKGYVLAGGASRRMGTDKARVPQAGWPAAVRLVEVLESAGLMVSLVRRGAPDGLPWVMPDGRPVRVCRETEGPPHPLRGVVSALEDAGEAVLVVPCDLPALDLATVQALCGGPGVAACAGQRHPLVAHVPWAWLPDLREAVRCNVSARAAMAQLPSVEVAAGALFDRNTPSAGSEVDALAARCAWMRPAARDRVLDGERARRAIRGLGDWPSDDR